MKRIGTKVALVGLFCLPTSSKFHVHEPSRSGAFKAGQEAFVLQATEEEGYPQAVILTAEEGELDFELGQEIQTQHAQVRKNLPPRKVVGILRADGATEGELPPKGLGLPHWAFIPKTDEGGASVTAISAVETLLAGNRKAAEDAKQAIRDMKSTKKSA